VQGSDFYAATQCIEGFLKLEKAIDHGTFTLRGYARYCMAPMERRQAAWMADRDWPRSTSRQGVCLEKAA
jgi:hypothetical protein